MKNYHYDFTIRLHDTDAAGVLFFAHLYRHAHDAYEAFMTDIGFSLKTLIDDKGRLPLVHSEADIQQPMQQGEDIKIQLQIGKIGDSSFTVNYLFIDQHNRQRANVSTTHVNLEKLLPKSQSLPKKLVRTLKQYLVEE